MAKEALRASDFAGRIESRAKLSSSRSRMAKLKGKKLKNLTAKEKDLLLKELAIRAGLLDDDGDD